MRRRLSLALLAALALFVPGVARAQAPYKIKPIARLGEMAGDTVLPSGGSYQFWLGSLSDSGQLSIALGTQSGGKPEMLLQAGLALLAPGMAHAQATYKIQPIISVGERASGLKVNDAADFELHVLNDQGQLAFVTEHETRGEYLFQYSGGQFTPIVIPGGDAAGVGKWATGVGVRGAGMNQQGNMVLSADLVVGDKTSLATFRWDAQKKALSPVALSGNPALNNLTYEIGGSDFAPAINNSDEVAFGAATKNAAGDARPGLYFLGRDNKLQAVALPDQALPDGKSIEFAYLASMNDAGQVAFLARGKGDKASSAYLWDKGTITPIAVIGSDTPGGGKLGDVWRVFINNKNSGALVAARAVDGKTTQLYRVADGKMTPVAVVGQEMPGGGKFAGLQADLANIFKVGGEAVSFNWAVSHANDQGEHAFTARLQDDSQGAYKMGADGTLSLILKTGMSTDLGQVKVIGEGEEVGGGSVASIGAAINGKGQVALALGIAGRKSMLAILTPQ